jgi:hypothetical protein
MDNLLEDDGTGMPPQPSQWAWITQRQETDGKSASIWKFGFIAPDGAEIRVTFHQVSSPTPDQSAPPQSSSGQDTSSAGAQDVIPQGQPAPDQTGDGVFYVTFFSNRNPTFYMKWDTSLSHEDSLIVWITITHGLVDFLRKAAPKNLILDDLGNGKLKMVLRSVTMDVVATDPDYTLELTKKHEYRSFYQIKKGGTPSAFDQAVNGKENEGQTQASAPPTPITGQPAPAGQDGQPAPGQDATADADKKEAPEGDGIAAESNPDATTPSSPQSQDAPVATNEPVVPKETVSKKGMTLEIGKDYSVTVKDRQNNVVDRFRGKNPLDILRWINKKGYGSNRMKIIDKETSSGPIAQAKEAGEADSQDNQNNQMKNEQYAIEGNKIVMHNLIPAKRAAQMNEIVSAERVRCKMESVEFEFTSDKDMDFKCMLVELAFKQTEPLDEVKKVKIEDVLPKSPGPVHIPQSMHNDLTRGGWSHLHGLSKAHPTHDYYEHRNHGRIMIDADGNHKRLHDLEYRSDLE